MTKENQSTHYQNTITGQNEKKILCYNTKTKQISKNKLANRIKPMFIYKCVSHFFDTSVRSEVSVLLLSIFFVPYNVVKHPGIFMPIVAHAL